MANNRDRKEADGGFNNTEETHQDSETGTEQVASGQLSGRQAVGMGQDTGYSRGEMDDSGLQEGQTRDSKMAGTGPLGGEPGRGDTADAHAWRQQTGMAGPSGRSNDEERLGVNRSTDDKG